MAKSRPPKAGKPPEDPPQAPEQPQDAQPEIKGPADLGTPKCPACGRPMPHDDGKRMKYTPEIAMEVCRRLADGEPLIDICDDETMPGLTMVKGWEIEDTGGFASLYARARDIGVDVMAEKLIRYAKDGSRDYTFTVTIGGAIIPITMHEVIARSRLIVDTIKWYISKLAPRKYGDRLNVELSGSVDINGLTDAALNMSIEQELMMAGVPEGLMAQLRPYITVVPLPDREQLLKLEGPRAKDGG